jgi:hypothetical protein
MLLTEEFIFADEVHVLGWKILESLYPQVIEIAKTVTNEDDDDKAVALFRTYINSSEMFFNKEPFPANESDERAYKICRSVAGKKKHFCLRVQFSN